MKDQFGAQCGPICGAVCELAAPELLTEQRKGTLSSKRQSPHDFCLKECGPFHDH